MANASTEDCKAIIQSNASSLGVPQSGWKRISKIKESDGWVRVFKHASGESLRVIEPFEQGAAGLRIEKVAPHESSHQSPFDAASDPMKAAMLWRDAMRVIGGKAPRYSKDPNAQGWSWSDFSEARQDFTGNNRREIVQQLTQEWVDQGMTDPSAKALLLDGISWCFDSDSEYADAEGYWDAGEGALVATWPTDADDEFGSYLGNPVYSTDLNNSSESVFHAGASAANGREAFIKAWEEMQGLGCHFDMAMQKKFNENGDYDDAHPMDQKIKRIIPELIAKSEASRIARAISVKPASSAKPRTI